MVTETEANQDIVTEDEDELSIPIMESVKNFRYWRNFVTLMRASNYACSVAHHGSIEPSLTMVALLNGTRQKAGCRDEFR